MASHPVSSVGSAPVSAQAFGSALSPHGVSAQDAAQFQAAGINLQWLLDMIVKFADKAPMFLEVLKQLLSLFGKPGAAP